MYVNVFILYKSVFGETNSNLYNFHLNAEFQKLNVQAKTETLQPAGDICGISTYPLKDCTQVL
jgi:hypothetical protein